VSPAAEVAVEKLLVTLQVCVTVDQSRIASAGHSRHVVNEASGPELGGQVSQTPFRRIWVAVQFWQTPWLFVP
jgi:hypothetical protein